jgi:hypothetical protein
LDLAELVSEDDTNSGRRGAKAGKMSRIKKVGPLKEQRRMTAKAAKGLQKLIDNIDQDSFEAVSLPPFGKYPPLSLLLPTNVNKYDKDIQRPYKASLIGQLISSKALM